MEALLQIRTKVGGEVLATKLDEFKKGKEAPKAPKAPKGVSESKKDGEFSKFTPVKTPNAPPTPAPWDDEEEDEMVSSVNLEDDGKFETENDIYAKQDQEWQALMEETNALVDDSASVDDASSEMQDDDAASDINSEDYSSDLSMGDSDMDDCEVFFTYGKIKETKSSKTLGKPPKIYSGVVIEFDDSE